jgi:type IV secretory pathway VirB10-like protein
MASEDQFRHYFPLMRRVIILVAVLTAVPVILWTITVFVRGYFGPPKIATARPLAAVSVVEAPVTPAASQDASARPPAAPQQAKVVDAPPFGEARATATDAPTLAPAAKGGTIWEQRQAGSDAGPPSSAPSAAMTAPAASAGGDQRAGHAAQMMAAAPAMPDASAPTTGTLAAQDPPETDQQQQSADAALPAAEPIAGAVPLPRHRPRALAMLQSGVPMPRPRPEAAGSTVSEGSATPLGWLQKLFTPQQQ